MRIDGEPWKQPLPVDDDTVTVEISNSGQVTMLTTPDCPARSLHDPASPHSYPDEEDEDSPDDNWEQERNKFGAANTFRIPDNVEIQHFS